MPDEDLVDEPEQLTGPEELLCAGCGSAEITRRPRARYFAAIALVSVCLGFMGARTEAVFFFVVAAAIFTMISDRWVCGECGKSWK